MTYGDYLEQDYENILEAAKKITGGASHYLDLAHYSICELSGKKNLQEVIDAGAARFYLVRVMMTQHRSVTGPFYRNYIKQSLPIVGEVRDQTDETDSTLEQHRKAQNIIETLPWYDRELFKLFVAGDHNYSSLSELTKIPRTSISLTIRRVREYVKSKM